MQKKRLIKENDYLVGSGANFTCAKISPNRCNVLAAGDDQNNIIIWKLTETNPRKRMTGKSPASTMIFSDSIQKLFTGTMSGMAHSWDIEKSTEIRSFRGHQAACSALCTSMSDTNLFTGGADAKVRVWDQRQEQCVATFREHGETVTCIRQSPDAKWIASGSSDGSVKIWDLRNNRMLQSFDFPG